MPELKFEPKIEEEKKPEEVSEIHGEPQEQELGQEFVRRELEEDKAEKELRKASYVVAIQMMNEARNEFPESIKTILYKKVTGAKLTKSEKGSLFKVLSLWWRKKFGMDFFHRNLGEEEIEVLKKKGKGSYKHDPNVEMNEIFQRLKNQNKKIQKRDNVAPAKNQKTETKLKKLTKQKKEKTLKLYRALANLDKGEPVDEFRDERRRTIFYDEDSSNYFILEAGTKKDLNIADILSDYAWGIKYVPDGEMVEPAYRIIAKRILTNEVRRNLESIYDEELTVRFKIDGGIRRVIDRVFEKDWFAILTNKDLKTPIAVLAGVVAEAMARELTNRLSYKQNLSFFVERANTLEDNKYKYDFKIRTTITRRGVGVGDEAEVKKRIKKIGVQFTIKYKNRGKIQQVMEAKKQYASELPVDDIVLIRINSFEFANAYTRWLKEGKPSGGPEQFLSEELKQQLLEAVMQGLV